MDSDGEHGRGGGAEGPGLRAVELSDEDAPPAREEQGGGVVPGQEVDYGAAVVDGGFRQVDARGQDEEN